MLEPATLGRVGLEKERKKERLLWHFFEKKRGKEGWQGLPQKNPLFCPGPRIAIKLFFTYLPTYLEKSLKNGITRIMLLHVAISPLLLKKMAF